MFRIERWVVFLAVFSFCFILSCQERDVWNEKAEHMADLECRAILLSQQRFTLADKIRFTQDTLVHIKLPADSLRLKDSLRRFDEEKNHLLQASLQLADTIRLSLDSLRKYTFVSLDDKKKFDQQLETILKKRGCEE